jgi:hypothetical protein
MMQALTPSDLNRVVVLAEDAINSNAPAMGRQTGANQVRKEDHITCCVGMYCPCLTLTHLHIHPFTYINIYI